MLPASVSIHDLPEFINALYRSDTPKKLILGKVIYRGQADSSWPVLPKVGRPEFRTQNPVHDPLVNREFGDTSHISVDDLLLFRQWRSEAIAYSSTLPENDLECLAIAQHYGLATRLLDWSTNPLVALYFACESHNCSQGAVFCFTPVSHLSCNTDLSGIPRVACFTPRPFDSRILTQSSCFTYHPNPLFPLDFTTVNVMTVIPHQTPEQTFRENFGTAYAGTHGLTLTVPAESKDTILWQLIEAGIHRRTLFPDLGGLSYFLNWRSKDPSFWLDAMLTKSSTITDKSNSHHL